MKKFPIGRIIATVIGVLILAFGINMLVTSHRSRQGFEEWKVARPIDIEVDFSKPGTFSGPLHQTCQISHDELLGIEVPKETLSDLTETELLEGLEFDCLITDEQGKAVIERNFKSNPDWETQRIDQMIPLLSILSFPNGDYTLTVHIKEGAPKLASIPQRLVARYMLCGMELMVAQISLIIGVVALVIATVLLLVVLVVTLQKRGIDSMPPTNNNETNDNPD